MPAITVTDESQEPHSLSADGTPPFDTVTLEAPGAPEEALWFFDGAEEASDVGTDTDLFIDGGQRLVADNDGRSFVPTEDDDEFVVGVVWWVDEGDGWVRHDATRTFTVV